MNKRKSLKGIKEIVINIKLLKSNIHYQDRRIVRYTRMAQNIKFFSGFSSITHTMDII